MKVDYINIEMHNDHARLTFMGYDAKGRRRPVIDLDAGNLAAIVQIAKDFRRRQKMLAERHNRRADTITQAGVALG